VPAVFDCFLCKQIQPDSNRPAHSFPPVIHHQRQKEEPMDDGLRPVRPTPLREDRFAWKMDDGRQMTDDGRQTTHPELSAL
jgi:hypothetical protein